MFKEFNSGRQWVMFFNPEAQIAPSQALVLKMICPPSKEG
jgi:hypothetical protein